MKLRYLSAIFAVILTGCASYVPPSGGALANLRILAPGVNGFTYSVAVHAYSDTTCGNKQKIAQLGGLGGSSKFEPIGMPQYKSAKDGEVTEIRIRAGQTFFLGLSLGKQWAGQCHLTSKFDPEAGGNYEALVDSTPEVCRVDIYELISSAGGQIKPKPIKSLAKNEQQCAPMM